MSMGVLPQIIATVTAVGPMVARLHDFVVRPGGRL